MTDHPDKTVEQLQLDAIQAAVGAAIANHISARNPAQAWDAGHSWIDRMIFKNPYEEFRR